jgi:hypothetical protein
VEQTKKPSEPIELFGDAVLQTATVDTFVMQLNLMCKTMDAVCRSSKQHSHKKRDDSHSWPGVLHGILYIAVVQYLLSVAGSRLELSSSMDRFC